LGGPGSLVRGFRLKGFRGDMPWGAEPEVPARSLVEPVSYPGTFASSALGAKEAPPSLKLSVVDVFSNLVSVHGNVNSICLSVCADRVPGTPSGTAAVDEFVVEGAVCEHKTLGLGFLCFCGGGPGDHMQPSAPCLQVAGFGAGCSLRVAQLEGFFGLGGRVRPLRWRGQEP
jgi:hypothetical protein